MNNGNQNEAKARCLGLGEVIDRVASPDASRCLGVACRKVLLAMRSAIDAAIERQQKKTEVKFQKVKVE
ncbi:MAG TPA: hypothetical protein EYO73_03895 [Sulfurimonas sp.]|nr:hypothetical protein [Sulfurimonas sp.]